MAIDSLPPRGAPPFLLSKPVPAVLRGRLYHVVGSVAFDDFRGAICAWSAIDALVDRRRECLAVMRSNAGVAVMPSRRAAKEEAELGRPDPPYLPGRRYVMNLHAEIREAQAIAQALRGAAAVCLPIQNVLKARLVVAADTLEQLASLATRALDRIEELEQGQQGGVL